MVKPSEKSSDEKLKLKIRYEACLEALIGGNVHEIGFLMII